MERSRIWLLVGVLILHAGGTAAPASPASEQPSPENQVFQFAFSGTCTAWSDGSKNTATTYLWIPEHCRQVRGLLILCTNVPENRLVGHPAIRAVCAANDLGIVWSTPSFMNFSQQKPGFAKMTDEHATIVAFLQQLLDGLARKSGYEEVATAPWLPMGESGHLLMVDALVEAAPQRCIAGIWMKNNHLPPHNRQTPALVAFGTAQEWTQDKSDIRTRWNDVGPAYERILDQRKKNPDWPLSFVIDGSSGHFDCSERLTACFARYIDRAAKARLSDDGSPSLKPVAIGKGFVADLPVPGHEGRPVEPAASHDPLPWYFDEPSAREAQAIANINWKAETQLPGLLDEHGDVAPFNFNGIMGLKSLKMEPDGITFKLHPILLDEIPKNFLDAGAKLAKAPGEPTMEWLCGPAAPAGKNTFRVAPGRGNETIYLAVRHEGTAHIRSVVQPVHIELQLTRTEAGKPQAIHFEKPRDVKAGADSIPLIATSDAGLPVRFYVESGPAVIQDNRLVFTPIPPRARFPVTVTVAAWQWGSPAEPKVQTAPIVKQTFQILRPAEAKDPK